MAKPVEKEFWDATACGRDTEVSSLLRDNPDIDVNMKNDNQWTPLHNASLLGHAKVVKLLLAHPNIEVNSKNEDGKTPLMYGCRWNEVYVVKLLLDDPRVLVHLCDCNGRTLLWHASYYNRIEIVELLIVCGKYIGDFIKQKGRQTNDFWYTALEIARNMKNIEVASLLERFTANPKKTCLEIRVKLGALNKLAAEHFALNIFLCEGLLRIRIPLDVYIGEGVSNRVIRKNMAVRFFSIIQKLPMELQMILCNRAVGSYKDSILTNDSEDAFRSLANFFFNVNQK